MFLIRLLDLEGEREREREKLAYQGGQMENVTI